MIFGIGHIVAGSVVGASIYVGSLLYAYNKGGADCQRDAAIRDAQKREANIIANNERAAQVKEDASRVYELNERLDREAAATGSGGGFSPVALHRITSVR